jgi:hypothetical protein
VTSRELGFLLMRLIVEEYFIIFNRREYLKTYSNKQFLSIRTEVFMTS